MPEIATPAAVASAGTERVAVEPAAAVTLVLAVMWISTRVPEAGSESSISVGAAQLGVQETIFAPTGRPVPITDWPTAKVPAGAVTLVSAAEDSVVSAVAVAVGIPGPEMPWPTCSGWSVATLVSSAEPVEVSAVPVLTGASAPQPCGKVSTSPASLVVPRLMTLNSPLVGSIARPAGCGGIGLSAQACSAPVESKRLTEPSAPAAIRVAPALET